MNLERTLAAAPDPILAHTAWERVCEQAEAREILGLSAEPRQYETVAAVAEEVV